MIVILATTIIREKMKTLLFLSHQAQISVNVVVFSDWTLQAWTC